MGRWMNDREGGRSCFWVKWIHWLVSWEGKSCSKSEGQCHPLLSSALETRVQAAHEWERVCSDVPCVMGWSYLSLRRDFLKFEPRCAVLETRSRCAPEHMELLGSWCMGHGRAGTIWHCRDLHHVACVESTRKSRLLMSVSDHRLTLKRPEWFCIGNWSFIKMGALLCPSESCFIQCQEQ